jgi:TonB family protein
LDETKLRNILRWIIYGLLIVVGLIDTTRCKAQKIDPATQQKNAFSVDQPTCEGVGILDEIADKNELELIQQQVVKPMIKRLYQSWLAHMPKEAAPPTSAQGVVKVTFTLLADGSVRDVVVTKPSALASLNEAAQMAVLDSHHEVVRRRPIGTPANPDMFPAEVHRSLLHVRAQFLYNTHCVAR